MVASLHQKGGMNASALATLWALLLVSTRAFAFDAGVSTLDLDASGCNLCHSGGTAPTVTFRNNSGNDIAAASVSRAGSVALRLRVSGGQSFGGMNVAPSQGATSGLLSSADGGVQTTAGTGSRTELTHVTQRAYSAGFAEFAFSFTPAPTAACGSAVSLSGWGLSSDGGGTALGDAGASDSLLLTITCAPTGTTCVDDAACSSGFCRDGYCCNQDCGLECDACAASLQAGSGVNGQCRPAVTTKVCDTAHTCSGFSTTCPGSCVNSGDCAGGFACVGADCVVPLPVGAACSAGAECQSTHCVDSVCCGSACTGTCEACSAATKESGTGDGTCGAAAVGTACSTAYECTGGSVCPTTCNTDEPCRPGYYCNAPSCVRQRSNGTVCSADAQCVSGFCADGRCCDAACDGPCDACAVANGGATDGACSLVSASSAGDPQCFPYVCDGAAAACPSSCSSDANCASGSYCDLNAGACIGTLADGSACNAPVQCTSGHCNDGFCCNDACAGACDVCALSLGAAANGTCTDLPPGTTAPPCGAYVCGSTGACRVDCAADGDCASGHYCEASACVPVLPPGGACAIDTACASGFCVGGVCCDSACNGPCQTCRVSGGAAADGECVNTTSSTACAPYLCSAGSPDCPLTCVGNADCAAPYACVGGACVAQGALGEPCAIPNDCASGFCVDGVCCDTSCGGQCEACATAGNLGTCSPQVGVPMGARNRCATDGGICAGSCDGFERQSCSYPGAALTCRAASCTVDQSTGAGLAVLDATCDGAGACGPLQTQSCGQYGCQGDICAGDCALDSDCAAGNFCRAGMCEQLAPLGAVCGAAGQCASGFCTDGVCCETACDGQCEACNQIAPGACVAIVGAPVGGRPVCASDGTVCAGACDGVDRQACAFPDASVNCRTPSCGPDPVTGRATAVLATTCDGTGACPPATRVECTPFECSGDGCATSCQVAADCSPGLYCDDGNCAAKAGIGEPCATPEGCTTGYCADGVCCQGACAGPCEACDLPERLGTCSAMAASDCASDPTGDDAGSTANPDVGGAMDSGDSSGRRHDDNGCSCSLATRTPSAAPLVLVILAGAVRRRLR